MKTGNETKRKQLKDYLSGIEDDKIKIIVIEAIHAAKSSQSRNQRLERIKRIIQS